MPIIALIALAARIVVPLITAWRTFALWLWLVLWKWPLIKFGLVMAIVVAVIAAIPWPEWVGTISGLYTGLPPGILWALDFMKFSQGMAILTSAWGLRQALRWTRAAISAS